jgi:8-oxo-dGTP pyrophosphatase MutT (NUDIX family)
MGAGRQGARAAVDRLVQRLAGSSPDHLTVRPFDVRLAAQFPSQPRAAAVLIGVTGTADEPGVLMTIRSEALRQHAGQISFPGGTIDTDEDPAVAALREAREEVGLPADAAEVIGYLPDHLVVTGFRITPVVARISPRFVPSPDHAEVQATFELPFSVLMDASNHRDSTRRIGDIEVPVRDIHFGEHRIWGATAGMLLTLYELAQP